MAVYLELTRDFNAGRLRAIVCSGQAVVLLRLAIASKDSDWILREDQESVDHVLAVLEARGAHYRFGAPLDLRWLRQGWSSHFEFRHAGMRVRTDFFTRPPRVDADGLARLWREQEGRDPPFTGPRILLEIKKTAREKDWPVIGELARLLQDPREQLCSRSAHDLIELDRVHPGLADRLVGQRPALAAIAAGVDELRLALERERFAAMDADARRVHAFMAAAAGLDRVWPEVQARTAGLPLRAAHGVVVDFAQRCLPTQPIGSSPGTSS
jgi:hypothetical protein